MSTEAPVSERPYRIVCIGGGTGLPVVLRGLREYRRRRLPGWEYIDPASVTAIVAFSDDGGSSGRLVREYDTLPPGDLRNCLLALADPARVPLMTQFFNHRFSSSEGETLAGHSAGNLLLVALAQLHEGDVRKAILDACRLLGIEGKIVFPTLAAAVLCAELADGTIVVGESALSLRASPHPIARVFLAARGAPDPRPETAPALPAMPEAVRAIAAADAIVLGPGSLYTSVIATLLVPGIAAAVRAARARRIYVANLMIEPGETDNLSVEDHLDAIRRHADFPIEYAIANKTRIAPNYVRLYAVERLHREIELVRRALEARARRSGEAVADSDLAPHFTRMQSLIEGLARPEADRGQVRIVCGGARLGGTEAVEIDAVREEQIGAGQDLKKVLRHDPDRLVAAILDVMARAAGRP